MLRDPGNPEQAAAALQRDAALARIVRTRRCVLAGAAALTAALAGLSSALIPGKSLGAKSRPVPVTPKTSASRTTSAAALRLPPPAGAAALGLRGQESHPPSSDSGASANSG